MAVNNFSDTNILWSSFFDGDDKAFGAVYYAFINALLSYGKKLTNDRELLNDSVQDVLWIYIRKVVKSTSHLVI